MKIPSGMSEAEVLAVINNIGCRLAHKFTFGYYTVEDIKQQAFIEACKGLEKYDESRPLENFLFVHIRNRLINFKRDHYERILDKPCNKCPLKAYNKNLPSECSEYINKEDCSLYKSWYDRNAPKKNLMSCLDIDNIDDTSESGMSRSVDIDSDIEHKKFLNLIDERLPMHLRASYLKLKAGVKIPRRDKEEIQVLVKDLMELVE